MVPKYAEVIEGSQSYALQVIKVTFPFNFDDLDKVKTLLERRFFSNGKYWTCKVDLGNAEKLKSWGFTLSQSLEDMLRTRDAAVGGTNIITAKTVKAIEVPGLRHELFPFQKIGVGFIEEKNGRALVADEMGLGKTVQALAWLQLHPELRPAIIVVPASLKLNWKREAENWMPAPKCEILSGTKPWKTYGEILIINYDILSAWTPYLKSLQAKVLVMDEIHCFPAGTKIDTPNGNINIEDLKIGDSVFNVIGIGKVEYVHKNNTSELIRLHLSNSKYIDVTPNHLFFTEIGWCPAKELINRNLFFSSDIFNTFVYNFKLKEYATNEKMRILWDTFFSKRKNKKILQYKLCREILRIFTIFQKHKGNKKLCSLWERIFSRGQQTFLWKILLSEMEDGSTRNQGSSIHVGKSKKDESQYERIPQEEPGKSRTIIYQDERKQPNKESKNGGENKSKLGDFWASINSSKIKRWKWKSFTKSTKNFMGCIRSILENGISNKYKTSKRFWLSYLLQSRHSTSRIQNLDRIGWLVPWLTRQERERSKKGIFSNNIRVERIEILKSGSDTELGNCVVYNLQISGHPSYYAEGALVHNCIKNSAAKRTKAVKQLAKGIFHVIGLSGTPIVNRPIEAYNALTIINSAAIPNFKVFTTRYCGAKHNGFGWDFTGASNTQELHQLLVNAFMIRRLKKDVLPELPDKIKAFVPMELSNQKEYDSAEADFISYLARTKGIAAAERANNAQTLAEIEGLKQLAVIGKMDQVMDWIEDFLETDQKLVVFAVHKFAIEALMGKFGKLAVKVDGSVSMIARQDAVDKFQTDPKCRLFVGNIQAAGVGITLTAASNVAFIELPWGPASVSQASDRVHRIGQKDSVTIHFLLAANTIEEKIARLLDSKQVILDSVLDGEATQQQSLLSELMKEYL